MSVITVERSQSARAIVDNLVTQGAMLFGDIAETAQELARLSAENAEQKATIDAQVAEARDLRTTIFDQRARIAEMSENSARLEHELADATARLAAISQTARGREAAPVERPAPPPANGHDTASKAGLAALEHLASTRGPIS